MKSPRHDARLVLSIGLSASMGVTALACGGADGENTGFGSAGSAGTAGTAGTGSPGSAGSGEDSATSGDPDGGSGAATTPGSSDPSGTGPGGEGDDAGEDAKFDIGSTDGNTGGTCGGPVPCNPCKVNPDEGNAVGECMMKSPPDSFQPAVQWQWDGALDVYPTPLVANMTDDNGDGVVDLCDVPDVIVVGGFGELRCCYQGGPAKIWVLDGATGSLHYESGPQVEISVNPALGDIDGDGVAEIVTATPSSDGGKSVNLIAFEHDGTLKWQSPDAWQGNAQPAPEFQWSAIALADLDNDGDVEIIAGTHLYDHTGKLLWAAPPKLGNVNAATAADLDGDGDLEVILGHAAYHHDGSEYYYDPTLESIELINGTTNLTGKFPQIANLDADPDPEILVVSKQYLAILEHDGTTKIKMPAPPGPSGSGALYPSTIHDFDGDSFPELAISTGTEYTVHESDFSITWSAPISDASGLAAGTAFDFLGDGVAEAMYADEYSMFIYDGKTGGVLMSAPRSSGTGIEYPTVADLDNDGSAEIVVVSNSTGAPGGKSAPAVQVIRDQQDRWIQARRIWNQHTYHVTNVREDSTIPQYEQPNWRTFNTFRTNAQIEAGGVCNPPPPEG